MASELSAALERVEALERELEQVKRAVQRMSEGGHLYGGISPEDYDKAVFRSILATDRVSVLEGGKKLWVQFIIPYAPSRVPEEDAGGMWEKPIEAAGRVMGEKRGWKTAGIGHSGLPAQLTLVFETPEGGAAAEAWLEEKRAEGGV